MSKIADNIAKVQARIQQAAHNNLRDVNQIRLLAVSKSQAVASIKEAISAGQREFGENYLQEALPKIEALAGQGLAWHFIGPVQSNKTAAIAGHFDWLHSLDRITVAERLSRQRPTGMPDLQCLVQLNLDDESSKSGIAVEALPGFVQKIAKLPGLALRGLMVIPAPRDLETAAGRDQLECAFRRTREQLEGLRRDWPELPLDTLSMGMSADLELAIAQGSTLVRIGTDVFGPRPPHKLARH